MTANERQVGGGHYRSAFQHWDLVARHGVRYLEGCATKYLVRAPRKNGCEDVEKALHYVEKIIELHDAGHYSLPIPVPQAALDAFAKSNTLEHWQAFAVQFLCTWRDRNDLTFVLNMLRSVLENASWD